MYALEVTDLSKNFGGVCAADGISFSVNEGETLGIIGPNGAGKTTVFNLVSGFYKPDRGTLKFYGKDITGLAPFKISCMGIGRTFQNLRLFNSLTVYENILSAALRKNPYGFFSGIFRTKGYYAREKTAEDGTKELIHFFRLNGKEDLPAGSLPYGEQRKLELARALVTEPKLLLVDEPGAGMNPREIRDLVVAMEEIRDRFRLTIVIIEHQMGLVMNISDRVAVLDFGEKIMEGTPVEVRNDKRVIEAYLGEEN